MRSVCSIPVILVCLALCAQAQEGPRPPDAPRRPGRGAPRRVHHDLMRLIGRLPAQLQLTAEQREQYEAIVAEHRERWVNQEGRRQEMRELGRQLREAHRAGDDERAEEIRTQMRAAAKGRMDAMDAFFDAVSAILDDEQRTRLADVRKRFERFEGRDPHGLSELVRHLPEELELTPEQREVYDELMEQQRQLLHGLRERYEALRPLYQELREAIQAGDEERTAEIEQKIEEARPERPNPLAVVEKLKEILTDEQKARLEELERTWGEDQLRGPEYSGAGDIRDLLRAARRLELTAEQETRLAEIRREAMVAAREARRDPERAAELAATVKQQIIEMLDANQANEFRNLLDRGPRGGRHGDRPPGYGDVDGRRGRGRGARGANVERPGE